MSCNCARYFGLAGVLFGSVGLVVAGAGCGGEEKVPARSADDAVEVTAKEAPGALSVTSEVGGMNEFDVDKAFKRSAEELLRCVNEGSSRVEFLGGSVAFWGKVGPSGKLEHVHVERSTLGDRATEQCMLRVLQQRSWPKPVGGSYGVIQKSFDFDAPRDVRPPVAWDSSRVEATVSKLHKKFEECQGYTSGFQATVYVNADGSVLAASVTPPNEAADTGTDCVVNELKAAKFPSPGSWPAKVTFQL